ncbi:tyrosine-type recombinase/integrase [Paraglaciecola psychrophila]|uniref:Phage integrase family site specific recombinase n=1 Tax=Paraglaciecola psychrophila 170 TaxID=1129794 RepID=K7ALQ2_9ALTE|nr:tyrosine-type recombinase/integrase [Paraglaciecola psychrophila]AGH44972.1 phage integrase family site specific recombinase [Paraglaciecola psychrophila 170]GAC36325.1 site-specific recombinase, phage integrase family protein [Paraglaciecola psychrophila 170]
MLLKKPVPLYPPYLDLCDFDFKDYPELKEIFSSNESWWLEQFNWGKVFLNYIGRNKSTHTYDRFRNDVERFLLWSFIEKKKPIDQLRKTDLLEFADFCWHPPVSWIGTSNQERFKIMNGYSCANEFWFPYKIQAPKSQKTQFIIDKKKYRPSQQTLSSMFTAIIVFYNYLMAEDFCIGNPAQIAKKDCRHFIIDSQVKEIKRLTGSQWQYVLDTAVEMADDNPVFERNLFVIVALKTLFLRISELSERTNWSPTMGHFWQDDDENWWLKIFGKSRKIRDITVPIDFLPFLERYRISRGLIGLPSSNENLVLVEKIRGQGGMTSRHLRRLVQSVLDQAHENMRTSEGENKALKLKEASAHWLRHTGASMEIERGRPLKDISEDLGHASMATTDTVYVQSENKKRAESGKQRKVD